MSTKRKITKFKYINNLIIIRFTLERDDTPYDEEHEFSSKDQPKIALTDALQNLGKHVLSICELDSDAEVEVTGFSLKYEKDENDEEFIKDCVITSKYKLQSSTGTIALNVPKRSQTNVDDGQLMPFGMAPDIRALIGFVEKYLDGDRVGKQEDLFDNTDQQDAEENFELEHDEVENQES